MYTWSKTDLREEIVQRLIEAYREHGREPGGWATGGPTALCGRVGAWRGLRDFEKFVVSFLYRLAQ